MAGFVSENGEDLNIVGLNNTAGNAELSVNLTTFPAKVKDKPIHLVLTDRSADCNKEGTAKIQNNPFAFSILEEVFLR